MFPFQIFCRSIEYLTSFLYLSQPIDLLNTQMGRSKKHQSYFEHIYIPITIHLKTEPSPKIPFKIDQNKTFHKPIPYRFALKVSFSLRIYAIVPIPSESPAWDCTFGSLTLMNGLICFSSAIVEGT